MRFFAICFLVIALCKGSSWPEEDDPLDADLDLLLDAMRQTRGSPPVAKNRDLDLDLDLESIRERYNINSILPNLRGDSFEEEGLTGFAYGSTPPSNPTTQRRGVATKKKINVPKSKYRKDSVDPDSLITRQKYQNAQAERLRQAFKEGKQQITLVSAADQLASTNRSWFVPCIREFYEGAYGIVRGCTPTVAHGGLCSRAVFDEFGTSEQMADMVEITERAMQNLFHQGGTTSLAPASSLDRLGTKGAILFQYFLFKVKTQLMYEFKLDSIFDSGALLTRLKADPPSDEWDMEPGHVYWNPHVDKANIPTYDYSALLYLNTHGQDFDGGEFAFIDDDADRVVQPRAGRLLMFTSGPENLHQVRELTRGTRYVLAMWFTCSEKFQYRDEE